PPPSTLLPTRRSSDLDVRAAREAAPRADQDHCLDRRIRLGAIELLEDAFSQLVAEAVDRRVIERDDGNRSPRRPRRGAHAISFRAAVSRAKLSRWCSVSPSESSMAVSRLK